MSMKLYSASYAAKFLGVAVATIHNWTKKEPEGFPEPDVVITALSGKNSAIGWFPESLRAMREWYVQQHGIDTDTAVARWSLIDNDLVKRHADANAHHTPTNIHPDQITIPLQRSGEAA